MPIGVPRPGGIPIGGPMGGLMPGGGPIIPERESSCDFLEDRRKHTKLSTKSEGISASTSKVALEPEWSS